MTSKSIECVVAHYNEDLEWINEIRDMAHITIYHKGTNPPKDAMQLPNVGREAHTFLTHIIQNYDVLADITLFLQGNPVDHFPDARIRCNCEHMVELAKRYGITTNISYAPYSEKDFMLKDFAYKHDATYGPWFERVLGICFPEEGIFWYIGATMAVRKDKILTRPKGFYERLLQEVNHSDTPIEAHYFERSWYYIFNIHTDTEMHENVKHTMFTDVIPRLLAEQKSMQEQTHITATEGSIDNTPTL